MIYYAAWKFIEDSNGNEERSGELSRKKGKKKKVAHMLSQLTWREKNKT